MQKLLQALTAPQPRTLYHFTDSRNVASIRQHGLLSLAALHDRGIAVAACGGDEDSRRVDARLGLDRFVHLSIMDQHPMEKIARDRGSIVAARYLRIDLRHRFAGWSWNCKDSCRKRLHIGHCHS